jgi:hypothetical protein
MSRLSGLNAETTWDPSGPLNGADSAPVLVTVPGARLGDFSFASFSLGNSSMALESYVSAADTVTCFFSNQSGATQNLGSGTLRVKVVPYDII